VRQAGAESPKEIRAPRLVQRGALNFLNSLQVYFSSNTWLIPLAPGMRTGKFICSVSVSEQHTANSPSMAQEADSGPPVLRLLSDLTFAGVCSALIPTVSASELTTPLP